VRKAILDRKWLVKDGTLVAGSGEKLITLRFRDEYASSETTLTKDDVALLGKLKTVQIVQLTDIKNGDAAAKALAGTASATDRRLFGDWDNNGTTDIADLTAFGNRFGLSN
jgi:hypothetical protein